MPENAFQQRLKMLAIVGFWLGMGLGTILYGLASERHAANLKDLYILKALKAAPHYEKSFAEMAARLGAEVFVRKGQKEIRFSPPRFVYYLLLGAGGGIGLGLAVGFIFFRHLRKKDDDDDFFLYPEEDDDDDHDDEKQEG